MNRPETNIKTNPNEIAIGGAGKNSITTSPDFVINESQLIISGADSDTKIKVSNENNDTLFTVSTDGTGGITVGASETTMTYIDGEDGIETPKLKVGAQGMIIENSANGEVFTVDPEVPSTTISGEVTTGDLTALGPVVAQSLLVALGDAVMGSNVSVSGNVDIASDLTVAGAATVGSLSVTNGDTNLNANLTVAGQTNLSNLLTVNNDMAITGDIYLGALPTANMLRRTGNGGTVRLQADGSVHLQANTGTVFASGEGGIIFECWRFAGQTAVFRMWGNMYANDFRVINPQGSSSAFQVLTPTEVPVMTIGNQDESADTKISGPNSATKFQVVQLDDTEIFTVDTTNGDVILSGPNSDTKLKILDEEGNMTLRVESSTGSITCGNLGCDGMIVTPTLAAEVLDSDEGTITSLTTNIFSFIPPTPEDPRIMIMNDDESYIAGAFNFFRHYTETIPTIMINQNSNIAFQVTKAADASPVLTVNHSTGVTTAKSLAVTDSGNTFLTVNGGFTTVTGVLDVKDASSGNYVARIGEGTTNSITLYGTTGQPTFSVSKNGIVQTQRSFSSFMNVGAGTSNPGTIRITSDSGVSTGQPRIYFGNSGKPGIGYSDIHNSIYLTLDDDYGEGVEISENFRGTFFQPRTDDTMSLGDSTNRWKEVYATYGVINTSDEQQKEEVEPIASSSKMEDLLDKIQPVSFKWKDDVSAQKHLGFSAQQIETVLQQEGISDFGALVKMQDKEGNTTYGVRYHEFIPILINSVQNLKRKLQEVDWDALPKKAKL